MTAPKQARETESGRFYSIPGYEDLEFRSVTNILNAISKPSLYNAYAKRAAVRAVDQEQEWHAIQYEECERLRTRKRNPLGPDEAKEKADEEARKWIARGMKDYAKYASECGSGVHKMCEMYDRATFDLDPAVPVALPASCLDDIMPYAVKMAEYQGNVSQAMARMQRHFEQFHRFVCEHNVKFLDTERTVCSPEHGYAGTLDAVVELEVGGALRRAVIDIKTGGVYKESVPLQLAAYRHATHEVHGDKTTPRILEGVDSAFVLQLKPQSYNIFPVDSSERVFDAFLHVSKVWDWMHEGCNDAVGERVD